jgi:serine protease Do
MTGEPVIALGNAYGYEHTVTRGIVSALHRNVQVTDTQSYNDLIQTDASINPGNSGGPLLNIDGEMIGVNVAVRAGAQGIGFAIPVDIAISTAAELMSIERLENRWHGLITEPSSRVGDPLLVRSVETGSPAEACGLAVGDSIKAVGEVRITRPLDLECALLGRRASELVSVEVVRNGQPVTCKLELATKGGSRLDSIARQTPVVEKSDHSGPVWELLGLHLLEEPRNTFANESSRYRGGMRVIDVRHDGPAARQGIRPGDILVGMHKWETASQQDIDFIARKASAGQLASMKFYVLRGHETLYGQIDVADATVRWPRR